MLMNDVFPSLVRSKLILAVPTLLKCVFCRLVLAKPVPLRLMLWNLMNCRLVFR